MDRPADHHEGWETILPPCGEQKAGWGAEQVLLEAIRQKLSQEEVVHVQSERVRGHWGAWGRQRSAESIATHPRSPFGLQVGWRTMRRELHGTVSTAERLQPILTSASVSHCIRCSGVKHTTTGLQSSGDVFSRVPHSPLSGNLMAESGFGGCQENRTCLTGLCQV